MEAVQVLPAGPMKALYLQLGLKVVHGWCELGTLPLAIPEQETIVQQVRTVLRLVDVWSLLRHHGH